MPLAQKEIKKRYFEKKKREAKKIDCACGCGSKILDIDNYGRPKKFVSGHNTRRYKNKYDHKKAWVKRNRPSVNAARTKRAKQLKVKLIEEYTHGKCAKCGKAYDGKNGAIFVFHHEDPSTKKFQIGQNTMNLAWQKIVVEVKKCSLLCANCHLILHRGEF